MIIFGADMAGALCVKQARDLGIKWPIAIVAPIALPPFCQAEGKYFEPDVYLCDKTISIWKELPDTHPYKSVLKEYDEAVMQAFNRPASMWDADGAVAAQFILNALKTAKPDADPAKFKEAREKIRDAMENTKGLKTVIGTITFSPTVHGGIDDPSRVAVIVQKGRKVLFSE